MYHQVWSCSSHSQTSYIPIWFWFVIEIRICVGMSNSVRCNIYLSWAASIEILNIFLAVLLILSIFNLSSSFQKESFFLESCDLRGLSMDSSYKGLRVSRHLWCISWSISERLRSFLTWLELLEKSLSILVLSLSWESSALTFTVPLSWSLC